MKFIYQDITLEENGESLVVHQVPRLIEGSDSSVILPYDLFRLSILFRWMQEKGISSFVYSGWNEDHEKILDRELDLFEKEILNYLQDVPKHKKELPFSS